MSQLRFEVGAFVMCNLGPSGWKLGRVIALRYREDHWPAGREAPYQVALEADHTLIFVPDDDARYCRATSEEDLRIARRTDALAPLPPGHDPSLEEEATSGSAGASAAADTELGCACSEGGGSSGGGAAAPQHGSPGYRSGRCHCCDRCPRNWSAVELYSEHYRCVARNGLKVTRRAVDLGTVRVGDTVRHDGGPGEGEGGFMQCPTLMRLPPGLRFSDDGALAGTVRFDPHRSAGRYAVDFVAVSTARWDDAAVGVVRLEISLVVEGNEPPPPQQQGPGPGEDDGDGPSSFSGFDGDAFAREQKHARASVHRLLDELSEAWERWERRELDNRKTCDR